MIRIKRVYRVATPRDGMRILVDQFGRGELAKNGLASLHGEKTWPRRTHFANGLDIN